MKEKMMKPDSGEEGHSQKRGLETARLTWLKPADRCTSATIKEWTSLTTSPPETGNHLRRGVPSIRHVIASQWGRRLKGDYPLKLAHRAASEFWKGSPITSRNKTGVPSNRSYTHRDFLRPQHRTNTHGERSPLGATHSGQPWPGWRGRARRSPVHTRTRRTHKVRGLREQCQLTLHGGAATGATICDGDTARTYTVWTPAPAHSASTGGGICCCSDVRPGGAAAAVKPVRKRNPPASDTRVKKKRLLSPPPPPNFWVFRDFEPITVDKTVFIAHSEALVPPPSLSLLGPILLGFVSDTLHINHFRTRCDPHLQEELTPSIQALYSRKDGKHGDTSGFRFIYKLIHELLRASSLLCHSFNLTQKKLQDVGFTATKTWLPLLSPITLICQTPNTPTCITHTHTL